VVDLIREGMTGILVPPGDTQTLAKRLGHLIEDAALRADLGSRARARAVQGFSYEDAVSRLIDLYYKVDKQQ